MTDISRGLRSKATIPPDQDSKILHPGGMPDVADSIWTEFRAKSLSRFKQEDSVFESLKSDDSNRTICHPSGIKRNLRAFMIRGYRYRSTPG
jgi:hypothetical protein